MSRSIAFALSACASLLVLAACEKPLPVETPTTAVIPPAAEQLLTDVRILSADDMEGRAIGTPGGERARAYIVSRLEAIGVEAPPVGRLQPFQAEGQNAEGQRVMSGVNIMGLIPGTRVTDRYIVVTAHYDHNGVHGGRTYNGADDNASGVATMLELATRLKAQPPEHSVLIVAFDGEEAGLLGAEHFVQAPPVPLSSIALNVNYDMTSRAETDGKLWVTGTYQNPTLRPILSGLPANGAIALAFGKDTPEDKGEDNWVQSSDHGPFHTAHVPFLYFGVNYHPDYHRPSDDSNASRRRFSSVRPNWPSQPSARWTFRWIADAKSPQSWSHRHLRQSVSSGLPAFGDDIWRRRVSIWGGFKS